MKAVLEYWPALYQGLLVTVWVAICSIVGAAIGSLILGPLRLSTNRLLRIGALVVIEFIRGASALVALFWVFYSLPSLPHMPRLSPIVASILVLSLIGASYGAEIVRGGILAIPRGQLDASHALGLGRFRTLTTVVLPQALSQIVPSFASLAADMVKWTSIVSFVGVRDLLYVGDSIRTATYETVSVYVLLGAIYWALCFICEILFRRVEHILPLNKALRATKHRNRPIASSQFETEGVKP